MKLDNICTHIEQKPSRFLSEMVLAPSLGLKKSVTIYRDVMCIVMDFLVAEVRNDGLCCKDSL